MCIRDRVLDINTDFMASGGNSIAAVTMVAEIEDRLKVRITLLHLVQNPTIAGIARIVDGNNDQTLWQSLIPLKPSGSKSPVIFVNAVGLHTMFLHSIVKYFDPDRPVLGLQLPGLNGETKPLTSIDDIAELYLKEIISAVPKGPYNLVSLCMGSVVAFEIAQRLKAMGRELGDFVVLDSRPPLIEKRDHSYKGRIWSAIAKLDEKPPIIKTWQFLQRVLEYSNYRSRINIDKAKNWLIVRCGTVKSKNKAYIERAHFASIHSFWKYHTKPIDHRIVLISSEWDAIPEHLGWEQFGNEFEVHKLAVGHLTMFTEPEVSILGNKLNSLLESKLDPRLEPKIEPKLDPQLELKLKPELELKLEPS